MYSRRTHYDVLKLKKSCSSDEVRESFTKLSKMVNSLTKLMLSSERWDDEIGTKNINNQFSIIQIRVKRVARSWTRGNSRRLWKRTKCSAKKRAEKLTIVRFHRPIRCTTQVHIMQHHHLDDLKENEGSMKATLPAGKIKWTITNHIQSKTIHLTRDFVQFKQKNLLISFQWLLSNSWTKG